MIPADRPLFMKAVLAAALMLWPLATFGVPAYFADSLSYYKGGQAAVEFVVDVLQPSPADSNSDQNAHGAGQAASVAENAKGARSVVYSVAAFLLGAPGASMVLLVVAQALAMGWIVAITARLAGIQSWSGFLTLAVVLAFATPAAMFVCYIVPDIFAGLLIASCVVLAAASERLSAGVRMSLAGIAAFAVTSHASHVPVAGGLFVLGSAWTLWRRGSAAEKMRKISWLAAPIVLGMLATVATGFIGFGTVSVAPKRYPLTLARSIEDGPSRWYLAEHCAERRYAVCEVFGPQMPDTVPDFLWENGLTGRATPEQMDRIRAEESEIVLAAARAYPLTQLRLTASNIAAQAWSIGLRDLTFDQRTVADQQGGIALVATGVDSRPVLTLVAWLSVFTALAALLWLAWKLRRMEACERAGAALLLAGLLGNAAVCAVFSGVADRYQARVVWLLPLFALAFVIASAERRWRGDG
jgi:hypothetical protein